MVVRSGSLVEVVAVGGARSGRRTRGTGSPPARAGPSSAAGPQPGRRRTHFGEAIAASSPGRLVGAEPSEATAPRRSTPAEEVELRRRSEPVEPLTRGTRPTPGTLRARSFDVGEGGQPLAGRQVAARQPGRPRLLANIATRAVSPVRRPATPPRPAPGRPPPRSRSRAARSACRSCAAGFAQLRFTAPRPWRRSLVGQLREDLGDQPGPARQVQRPVAQQQLHRQQPHARSSSRPLSSRPAHGAETASARAIAGAAANPPIIGQYPEAAAAQDRAGCRRGSGSGSRPAARHPMIMG